ARCDTANDPAEQSQARSIERARQLPRITIADGDLLAREDVTLIIPFCDHVNGHSSDGISSVDRGEERVRSAVPWKQRWMRADGTEGRVEPAPFDAPREVPADDQIRPARCHRVVDAGREWGGAVQPSVDEGHGGQLSEPPSPRGVRRTQYDEWKGDAVRREE